MTINHQWQLVQRPSGEASTDNFALVSAPIPSLLEGQVLVRASRVPGVVASGKQKAA
jgi:NADPH-dependent curcumin reductase CurA